MLRWAPTTLLALALSAPAAAQDTTLLAAPPVAARLTITEAIGLAKRESPTYRQTLNDLSPAKTGVRAAYGAFIPTLSANGGVNYTGEGSQFFGGQTFTQPSSYGSSYGLNFSWAIDGRVIANVSQQKANRRATDADIDGADQRLVFEVNDQYLASLAADAQVEVARQQVRRNIDFLKLAEARNRVGQATLLDVRQAQTTLGQSEVALLNAQQASNAAKLELFRRMGMEPQVPVEQIALADDFPLQPLGQALPDLVRMAEAENPTLRAIAAREDAAQAGLRAARAEYLPTLRVNGGWSGYTQQFSNSNLELSRALQGGIAGRQSCLDNNVIRANVGLSTTPDCNLANGLDASGGALLPEVRQSILDANQSFPFDFQSNPFQVNVSLSIPLFTGFARSNRIAQARAQRLDAEEAVRAQRLQLRADVETRQRAAEIAFRTIEIQARNRDAARDQLRLAQDRYRLGSGSALEVSDAQNAVQRAEGDYVNAVYGYHRAVAALEVTVGRALR